MMMRFAVAAATVVLGSVCALAGAQDLEATLSPVGGQFGMFNRPAPAAGAKIEPVPLQLQFHNVGKARKVQVSFSAQDIFGKAVDWKQEVAVDLPADSNVAQPISLDAGMGYFLVKASIKPDDGEAFSRTVDIGVIPPPWPGFRKDSFFASNVGITTTPEFLQCIGLKICRNHFSPSVATKVKDWASKPSDGNALPLDFTAQDKAWETGKGLGLWMLPIVGYSFQGSGGTAKSELAMQLGMHGPPRDFPEFVNTWKQILEHYPEITTYEFWNEPWIFGWTWAAPPSEYQKLQQMWCEMALKVNPQYRILAGNSSMFVTDNIEPEPNCWKGLLSGVTHHPYTHCGDPTMRECGQGRSIDDGMEVAKRMHLPYYYLTEGGSEYTAPLGEAAAQVAERLAEVKKQLAAFKTPEEKKSPQAVTLAGEQKALTVKLASYGDPHNNFQNACKIVQYHMLTALCGGFQCDAQYEIGYGPRWTRANTSYAFMTHMLEDRPCVSEVWPQNELLWGAIFANPKFATDAVKALPRAKDLAARWSVPVPEDRAADTTKVAIVYALTGPTMDKLDAAGTLTIADATGLTAYDLTGRVIPAAGNQLTVPLGQAPVYITTDTLDVVEFRDRLANAKIANVTAVNLYALSLNQPADKPQDLQVRVENQLNVQANGTLTLKIEGVAKPVTAEFAIPAGQLVEVPVAWPGVPLSANNQYAVTLTANVVSPGNDRKLAATVKQQIVSAACFVKRTIALDGKLDDWKGVTPVLIDSSMLKGEIDITQYYLNPHLDKPTDANGAPRVVARVYTAYDKDNIYIAAAVNEANFYNSAGKPVFKTRRGGGAAWMNTKSGSPGPEMIELPYRTGEPDGLGLSLYGGDALSLAFGFRDRVPGWGRQADDPWAWKGHFYDTDYHYMANPSTDGDQLIRMWGPDMARRNPYQCVKVPGVGPVTGAKIKIARDEDQKLTLYEMSIPRTEVTMFDPSKGRCRFGFILYTDIKAGGGKSMSWAEASGVFDYWQSAGSFLPSWVSALPCQTFFGIEKE